MPRHQDPVRPPPSDQLPVLAMGTGNEANSDEVEQSDVGEQAFEEYVAQMSGSELDETICEVCDPADEEAVQPHRVMRNPQMPTQKEKEDHRCTHWPYRSWCKYCVMGRGQHDQHRKKKKRDELPEIPTISIDFVFPGTREVPARKNAMLFMFDNSSESPWVYRTGGKRQPGWFNPSHD